MKITRAVTQEKIGSLGGYPVIVERSIADDDAVVQPMRSLAALIPNRPSVQTKARCEREELIEQIADRLNEGRIKDGFRPLSYRDVALTLHGRQTHEVAILFKERARQKLRQIFLVEGKAPCLKAVSGLLTSNTGRKV